MNYNKKKNIIIILTSLLFVITITLLITKYINEKIIITINGSNTIKLNVFDEYQELGAKAQLCHFKNCKDITDNININSNLDVNKIGNYVIKYQVDHDNKIYTKKRKIKVIDEEKPEIELTGGNKRTICPSSKYKEEGYIAYDNYDGDLTDKVVVKKENNNYTYVVSDFSGNQTKIVRTIEYKDDEKPLLNIIGSKNIVLAINSNYTEYGATISDNCGNIAEKDIKITNNIDLTKEGTYNVNYSITDKAGNVSTANRTVKVEKQTSFETTDKNIYQENLEKYIRDKNYRVSLGYVNLNTGYKYLYNPDTVYYGASLVKTVDALYIYEKLNFDEQTRKNVEKAISVSDNDAHRKLVNQIGIENLRLYGRNLGAQNFLTRSNSDYFGNTTVHDQIEIWTYLYKFINTNSKGNELKQYFINDYFSFMQFDGIPTTMHKYGWYGDYYHNVGIVFSEKPYLVVILTKHGAGNFRDITKDLSKKIYELNKID